MEVFVPLVAVVAAFYLILMRPVIRQQRKRRSDISSLGIGDEVLTAGGFYATVRDIRTSDEGPMVILLEVAPGIVLRGTPSAIDSIARRADPAVEAERDAVPRVSDA